MPTTHIHEHNELYFLVSGQTEYFVGTSIYRINDGDFILIPKGVFHRTDNSRFPNLERILINFDDEFLGEEYAPYLAEMTANPHIRLPENEIPRFLRLLQKIEQETNSDQKGCNELTQLYFKELIVMLSRHRRTDDFSELTSAQQIVQDAARYINLNYRKPLNLEVLAQKYSVSEGYFSKIFKNYTGIRVREYINLSRVLAAKDLFETTDLQVTEVAFECGFNDSNYFSEVFKKITGVSPKKYSLNNKSI